MERVPFIVLGDALKADGAESRAVLARLKTGQRVQVGIYQERPRFLSNRAARVFELIAEARGTRVRNIRAWIAIGTGHADLATIDGGKVIVVAHGTGPRDMSAAEFELFWEDAVDFIKRIILPTLRPSQRAEIEPLLWTETGASRTAAAPS